MKRKLVALVGLVLVSGLLLCPTAARRAGRKAHAAYAPSSVLALRTIKGWDWGGSGGS